MLRNVMHMEQIKVGVHTLIFFQFLIQFSYHRIYRALARFYVHMEKSYMQIGLEE